MYKHLTLASLTIRPGSTDMLNMPSKIGGTLYPSEWKKLGMVEKINETHTQTEKNKVKFARGSVF